MYVRFFWDVAFHLKAEECEMEFIVPEQIIYPLQFFNT